MNCSYLSIKCEHVSILIPIMFTFKVQENLNNIVRVLGPYNVHYKTFLPSEQKKFFHIHNYVDVWLHLNNIHIYFR